jgi:hypothetical protein
MIIGEGAWWWVVVVVGFGLEGDQNGDFGSQGSSGGVMGSGGW